MSDPEELVKNIQEIVDTLAGVGVDTLSGDTLSRLAVKLASLKASLGVYVVETKYHVYQLEADYQLAKVEGFKESLKTMSATAAKDMKYEHVVEALASLNEAKYNNDKVTQLSKDCHDLIDAIKSRLINLQTERSESNVS